MIVFEKIAELLLAHQREMLTYFVAVNAAAFIIFGFDKYKAMTKMWRIPERILLFLSFLGGAIGGYLGMKTFHHKTRKWRFRLGVPLMLILQLIIIGGGAYIAYFR